MVGQRLSFTTSLCLFIFSTFHNSVFVVSQRGRPEPHPEFIPEQPAEYPKASPYVGSANSLIGTNAGGKPQPFLTADQDGYDVATLRHLLMSFSTVIDSLNEQVTKAKNDNSTIDWATITVSPSTAQVGCSVYSAYQTLCEVGTPAPEDPSLCPGILCRTPSSEDLFASCACYSSTWWVPDLYDNAVWACNQVSAGNTGFTAWVTTTIGKQGVGFCAYNNPRVAAFAYGLSTAATTTSTSTMTPTPTSTPIPAATATSTTASPTTSSSASTFIMKGVGGMGKLRWMLVEVIAIVIALV